MAIPVDANGRQTAPSTNTAQNKRHEDETQNKRDDSEQPTPTPDSEFDEQIQAQAQESAHEQSQDDKLKALEEQNEALRKQTEAQQKEIDSLKQQLQSTQTNGPQAQGQEAQQAGQTQPQAPQNGPQGPQASQQSNTPQQPQNGPQNGAQAPQNAPQGNQPTPNSMQQALDIQEQNHPGSTEQGNSADGAKNGDQAENEVNFADMKNLAAKLTTTSGSEREQILAQLLSAIVASMQALYNKVSGIAKPQAQNQQQTDLNTQAQQQTQEQAQNGTVNPSNPQQSSQTQSTTYQTAHQAVAQTGSNTSSQSENSQESQRTPAELNEELRTKYPDNYKDILGAARSMAFAKENGLQINIPTEEQMVKNGMSQEDAQKQQDIYDAAKSYCNDMEKATATMPDNQRKTPYEAIAQEHDASRHAVTAKNLSEKNPLLNTTANIASMTPGAQTALNKNLEAQKVAREFSIASENGMGMSMTGESQISEATFDKAAAIYNNTRATNKQTKTIAIDNKIALSEIATGKLNAQEVTKNGPAFNDNAFAQGAQDMNKQLDNSVTVDPTKLQPTQPSTQKATEIDQTYSA